jgi:hypothetical protein
LACSATNSPWMAARVASSSARRPSAREAPPALRGRCHLELVPYHSWCHTPFIHAVIRPTPPAPLPCALRARREGGDLGVRSAALPSGCSERLGRGGGTTDHTCFAHAAIRPTPPAPLPCALRTRCRRVSRREGGASDARSAALLSGCSERLGRGGGTTDHTCFTPAAIRPTPPAPLPCALRARREGGDLGVRSAALL